MYPKNRFVKLNERKHLVKDFFRLSMGLFNCFDFEQSLRGQRNSFVVRNIIWFSLLIFFEFHHVLKQACRSGGARAMEPPVFG